MPDKTLPRPPQVTLLGGAILVGSVLMVMVAFDRIASLGSIEEQEAAARFVDRGLGRGLGIDADQWQTVLRVMCLVAGGTGVVTAFLGWQVLQRDRGARVALSALAPVLLVAGTSTADYVATIVVVAIVLLWRQPSRDWFNGVAMKPRPAPVRAPDPRPRETVHAGPTGTNGPAGTNGPDPTPYAGAPWPPPPAPQTRPGGLTAAVITTVVGSGLVIAAVLLGLVTILADRSQVEQEVADEMASQPAYSDLDLDSGVLVAVIIAMLIAFAVWAVVAIVLAVLTLRGSNGARIALIVSAFGSAMASLLGVLAIFPLVLTGASVAVAVLLMRADTAAWFAAHRRRP